MTKSNFGEGRIYFSLDNQVTLHLWGEAGTGTQGRKLEVGAEAEAIEEHHWLACSVCFLRPSSRTRGSTTPSGPDPPPQPLRQHP